MKDDEMKRLSDWEDKEENRLRLLDEEWEYRFTEPFKKTDDKAVDDD